MSNKVSITYGPLINGNCNSHALCALLLLSLLFVLYKYSMSTAVFVYFMNICVIYYIVS